MRVLCGLTLLVLLGLSGCATLSDEQCKTVDWRALGIRDGDRGYPLTRLSQHVEACEFHGLPVDRGRYRAGYATGNARYCRPANGFRVGRAGGSYQGVCPAGLDTRFRRNHAAGYAVYSIESDIRRLESEIDYEERRLIKDKDLTDKQRRRLREDIRDMDRNVRRLRDDLREAEDTLDRLMRADSRG